MNRLDWIAPVLLCAGGDAETIVRGDAALRVDAFLSRLAGFDYSGSILIEKDDEVVLRKAYGFADRSRGLANRPDACFDIGSMSKQFTAAAILVLQRAGKLSVNDSLGGLLPNVPADKKEITVQQLLTHTAGLPSDFPLVDTSEPEYENVVHDEAVRRILAARLLFRPGSTWSYSNCGYVLLAAIVQSVSGAPFPTYMRDTIFRPAGLDHTGFWCDAELASRPVQLGHDAFGTILHDPRSRPLSWFDLGGGEVVSTLDDLRTWIHVLDDHTLLDEEQVEELFVPGTQVSTPRGRYALGWFVQETPRHGRLIHHGGDYVGCGADLAWFRDEHLVIVSSTNVRHDVNPTRNCMQSLVPELFFGDSTAPEIPAFEKLDAEPPEGFAGTYALATRALLQIGRVRGRTYLWAEGQAATDLLAPTSEAFRADRAWRTSAAQRAFDGIVSGRLEALDELLGPSPNPAFRPALLAEVTAPGKGKLAGATVLGSYATGYPHGNPAGTETTLLRLQYADASRTYAIRWTGRAIAWTEMVTHPGAAAIPLQRAADGSWVGWHLLEKYAVTVRTRDDGGGRAIEVSCGGTTEVARRT